MRKLLKRVRMDETERIGKLYREHQPVAKISRDTPIGGSDEASNKSTQIIPIERKGNIL